MDEPKFVDELPPLQKAESGCWNTILEPLKARQGVWAEVAEKTERAAATAASNLRLRKIHRPDGFEFASRGTKVYARYVGGKK